MVVVLDGSKRQKSSADTLTYQQRFDGAFPAWPRCDPRLFYMQNGAVCFIKTESKTRHWEVKYMRDGELFTIGPFEKLTHAYDAARNIGIVK